MKILAFTDTHGNKKPLERIKKIILQEKRKKQPVDVAVCCGDFTIFGQKMSVPLKKMNGLGVKVALIHGNHESASIVRRKCGKYKNIIFIDRDRCRFGNFVFMGYGGGGFALQDKTVLRWGREQFKKIKKTDKVVLLFHGPPHGTNLDVVGGGHCGNKDYTKFIRKNHKQLYLVLAGHIHECNGQIDKIKDVIVANPGPMGRMFEMR